MFAAHPRVRTLTHLLATAQSLYLPAEKVSEQLPSPLDYRLCAYILFPSFFQPAFHPRTLLSCCRHCTNTEKAFTLWRDRADKSSLITPTYIWKSVLVSLNWMTTPKAITSDLQVGLWQLRFQLRHLSCLKCLSPSLGEAQELTRNKRARKQTCPQHPDTLPYL